MGIFTRQISSVSYFIRPRSTVGLRALKMEADFITVVMGRVSDMVLVRDTCNIEHKNESELVSLLDILTDETFVF